MIYLLRCAVISLCYPLLCLVFLLYHLICLSNKIVFDGFLKLSPNFFSETDLSVVSLASKEQLKPRSPPPPTPGPCGVMWGIFMVFEGMVSPRELGISQDLLSTFMAVHGSRGARWGFDSCLVSSR